MISAMYENGGNTTHRILDGHPELLVYPFESQLGTRMVNDRWAAMYPTKYRWPVFALGADAGSHFDAIIDEETRVRSRTPQVSKFRDHPFDMADEERRERFVALMGGIPFTRANLVAAFFEATFGAWRDVSLTGRERAWVGYSPVFGIDAEVFLSEMRHGHLLHVVRNPWSAYAETKHRPVPLRLAHYVEAWVALQAVVLAAREAVGDRITIVRFEDICDDPRAALTPFCERMRIDPAALDPLPSWNGRRLEKVFPWGTIVEATPAANRATAAELSEAERAEVTRRARVLLDAFGYARYLETVTP
jgi:hypothetical protein